MSNKIPEYYGIGDISKIDQAQLGITLEDMYQKLAFATNKANDVTISIAPDGYIIFGGLIIQWGSVPALTTGALFTWPTPFLNNVFSVTLGIQIIPPAGPQYSAFAPPTLNNVVVYATGGNRINIMAIGN